MHAFEAMASYNSNEAAELQQNPKTRCLGVRIKGGLGDVDPLNKVPFQRARNEPEIR